LKLDPLSPAAFAFIARVEQAYASLAESAARGEASLGGKLLYAGELDEQGCALAVAGNISGAATLAASADQAARKQAMREGVVDFLVTSLDEALRILKNQIRKREPVAVCVGAAPAAVEREMLERGVKPDLALAEIAAGFAPDAGTWLTWRAADAPALWMPKLDAIALDCLPPGAWAARRWLQLAPRYLGRLAQGARVLHTTGEFAAIIAAQFSEQAASGAISVPIEIGIGPWESSRLRRLTPPHWPQSAPTAP
jgi:urocanate hydratase